MSTQASTQALSPEIIETLESAGQADQSAPAWLASVRAAGADSLRARGLPTRKHEAWRFTPVKGVVQHAHQAGAALAPQPDDRADALSAESITALFADHLPAAADATAARVFVVNGRALLDAEDAGPALPAGVAVANLSSASPALAEAAARALGQVSQSEHFAALNAALFEDALIVHVAQDARPERPLQLVHASVPGADSDRPACVYPRVVVVVEPGAELCLIESTMAKAGTAQLISAVTEVVVGAGATVEHVRAQYGADAVYQLARVGVRQHERSTYRSRVVTLGGTLNRLDLEVALAGEGATCLLDGAYHADSGEHVEHQTRVDHQVPSCNSNQRYRGIIDGTGHAVFDATALVQRDAQHSDAHQENRNLLLSDDAVVNTKPHLRIDADDVSCSHGTTVGALDDAQLFYLRTRAIDEAQARAMLTYAFVRAVIDDIPHAPLADSLAAKMRARLPHGETLAPETDHVDH
ncbi:MAG: Fe-S cluster assembly protein SufD [Haliangiales bacterium]